MAQLDTVRVARTHVKSENVSDVRYASGRIGFVREREAFILRARMTWNGGVDVMFCVMMAGKVSYVPRKVDEKKSGSDEMFPKADS